MTHPTEIKPREGDQNGTPWAAFKPDAALPPVEFTITPEIVEQYASAVAADSDVYEIDGRPVAPPNVLAVYLLAVLYRRYPPIQGIILAKQNWRWNQPIWADETTKVVADGRIVDVYERRGKSYVRWSARFLDGKGNPIASAENTIYLPQ